MKLLAPAGALLALASASASQAPAPPHPQVRSVPCEVMNLFYEDVARRRPPYQRPRSPGEINRATRWIA